MSAVFSAFPRRPIRILRTGVPSVLGLIAIALTILALAGGAAVWLGPGIIRDRQIGSDPVAVPQARITDGKCRSKLILVTCEAKMAYSVDGRRYATSTEFFFVDLHFGDYTAGVVRSARRPELATLDIGLESMANRIATLLAIVGGLGAIGLVMIGRAVQAARLKRLARTADQVTPVAVTVLNISKHWLGRTIACSYESPSGRRKFSETFGKSEAPFALGGASVLAVLPANSATPLLVDEAVARLDLTDAERHALYIARAQAADALGA